MAPRLFWALFLGAFAAPGLGPTTAATQEPDSLRAYYSIDLPPTLEVLAAATRASPGSTSASPTGFGAGWGTAFVGLSYQHRARFVDAEDGALVAGIGLGSARRLIGMEVVATSFSTLRSPPLEVVALSLKAHRALPGQVGVAVGWESALFLSENEGDGGSSLYGAVSKVWPGAHWHPFVAITTTAGLGNGRFRTEDDVRRGDETLNVFGSIAVQLLEPASFIADWTGQDLTLALSIVPLARFPLVLTPAVTDLTGAAGDGARFIITAGTAFDLSRIRRPFPR